jgi:glycosyltransferase involved in cell wall biosynthesis
MKKLIIIPAYNEEKSLKNLIEKIRKEASSFDLIVVNDCSTDATLEKLKDIDVTHLDLPVNLGIGGAMQAGYKYALRENYDIAVQVDGDGQHLPSEISKLETVMEKTRADMVIGSRFFRKTTYRQTLSRRLGILLFSFLIKLLTGEAVTDATSGFRLVNRRVIRLFANDYPTDYPEPEVLIPLKRNGFKIIETPVIMNSRSSGRSSITAVKSVYYMVKVIFAMLIEKIRKA